MLQLYLLNKGRYIPHNVQQLDMERLEAKDNGGMQEEDGKRSGYGEASVRVKEDNSGSSRGYHQYQGEETGLRAGAREDDGQGGYKIGDKLQTDRLRC